MTRPLRRRSDLPRRLWRRFSHNPAARVVVSFVVLFVVAVIAVQVDHQTANQAFDRASSAERRATVALTLAEQRACHRLNVHRLLQDDRNAFAEWKFDVLFANAIKHPLPGGPKPTRAEEAQRAQAYNLLVNIVNTMTWTPATDSCAHAGVGSSPIRFSVRQPTKAELQLQAGQ